jgi:hypothetical protein
MRNGTPGRTLTCNRDDRKEFAVLATIARMFDRDDLGDEPKKR